VATGALAGAVPAVEPPLQLRAKVLAQVAPKQKMVTLPERKPGLAGWLGWAFATGLAVVCLVLFATCSKLSVENSELRGAIAAQNKMETKLVEYAESLEAATNSLQETVLALQETNRLANLKIAMLNSLMADAPKTVAVSLWDESKQEGVFVVQNLKQLPADRDYQLWVLDNGTTPVDAGVFHVDANGSVRVEFKAKALIQNAGKFAVTEEAKGGVASPTIANMVLASN
jgi:anti-sigma-K factor RskA